MTHKGFTIIDETETLKVGMIFAVLYGLPGTGKTSTSFTMPKPILHIDADNGLRRAVQKLRPKSVKVEQYGPFFDFIMSNDFEAYCQKEGFKSVVIDTVGTLLDDLISPWLIKNDPKNGNSTGGLSLQGWGALKTNFNVLKARFQALNLHVVCICHAKEEGESNSRRFELAVSGGSTEIIYRTADLIGFVTVQGERRLINFNPTNTNIGKNVGNIPAQSIPSADLAQYDTFLTSIVDQVTANMQSASEAQIEFNTRLDEWRDIITAAKKTTDFDKIIGDAKAMPDGLLKTSVRQLIGEAMEASFFVFDKETGKVVDKAKPKKGKKAEATEEAESAVESEVGENGEQIIREA